MTHIKTLPGILVLFALVLSDLHCSKDKNPVVVTPTPFAKGADIGWLTQMEASGVKFYNNSGTEQECMQILKDKGINAIRIRAWVNPVDGWNNTRDVVVKAVRAKNLDMKIMIDFHYSDTWADPGHQPKPAAWISLSFADLKTALSNYTVKVMDTLKVNGITPDWVQIGNETNNGMLWEDGKASTHMNNFAALIGAGYSAVKSVSSTTQVIVHISNGFDISLFRWIFDGLQSNGAPWDIIGMSLYPSYTSGGVSSWGSINSQCLSNMQDMISRYNKPVMVVEVGMPANEAATCKLFLTDLIAKTKSLPDGKGLGVFYWEPECYSNWQGYGLGAFDDNGRPSEAMDAFLN